MKFFWGILIAAQLIITPSTASEMAFLEEPNFFVENAGEEAEPTRVEEFKWYYRTYEGQCQRRLWSVTYGHWVTDWLPCNTQG